MGTNEVPPCGKPWWYNTQHGKSKFGYPENATVTKDKKTKSSILKSRYSKTLINDGDIVYSYLKTLNFITVIFTVVFLYLRCSKL